MTTEPFHAPEAANSPLQTGRDTLHAAFLGASPLPLAVAYLLTFTVAELLTTLVYVQLGVVLHLAGLFMLLLHAAAVWETSSSRFLLALTLVPLIRVVSLSLPLAGLPIAFWYLITSVPLFAAAAVVMRLLGMGWRDLGLNSRAWPLQIPVALAGILFGYVEYLILRPEPLAGAFTWEQLWLPALILLVSTGFLEELIFRRIMQRTAVERLGPWRGILYVALLFAVLHVGYQSLFDVILVFLAGLAFAVVVQRTGSLVGVSLAHGLTNIFLFLVMPFWAAGALPLPPMPEQRLALPALAQFQFPTVLESRPLLPGGASLPANAEYLSTPWHPPTATFSPTTMVPTAMPFSTTPTSGSASASVHATGSATFPASVMALPSPTAGASPTLPASATAGATATAQASATPCLPPTTWLTYTVLPGETLFRIGLRYGLTALQLQLANCLPSTTVFAGQVLYVPFALPSPSSTPTPTILPTASTTPPPPLPTSTPPPPTATSPPTATAPPLPSATAPPPTATPTAPLPTATSLRFTATPPLVTTTPPSSHQGPAP